MSKHKVNKKLSIVYTFGGNGSDAFTTQLTEQSATAGWPPRVEGRRSRGSSPRWSGAGPRPFLQMAGGAMMDRSFSHRSVTATARNEQMPPAALGHEPPDAYRPCNPADMKTVSAPPRWDRFFAT